MKSLMYFLKKNLIMSYCLSFRSTYPQMGIFQNKTMTYSPLRIFVPTKFTGNFVAIQYIVYTYPL